MAALGDILFRGSTRWNRLAGNTTANRRYLTQTGDGVASAAPVWNTIIGTDVGGFTAGSVIFAGATGFLSEDNANLFWHRTNLRLGLRTTAPACALDVRGPGVDIGYLARFQENNVAGSSYIQIISPSGNANSQAGFTVFQQQNNAEWRFAVIGNDGNAFRISGGVGVATSRFYITANGNMVIGESNLDPATGTQCLIFGDGTAPSSLDANSAGLYADDVGGTVNIFGINEAGEITRLTWPAPQTYTVTNVTPDRSYDADATTLDEIADVLGTLIDDLRNRGIVA